MINWSSRAWTILVVTSLVPQHDANIPAATQVDAPRDRQMLSWTTYDSLSRIIESSATWTKDGPNNREDWDSVVLAAIALQKAPPEAVEVALVSYMIVSSRNAADESYATKPMLLLRVMFDLPEEGPSSVMGPFAAPCGGMPFECLEKDAKWKPVMLPIHWGAHGPELVAVPKHTEGSLKRAYEPQKEFRYFYDRIPYRIGLEKLIGKHLNSWEDYFDVKKPKKP